MPPVTRVLLLANLAIYFVDMLFLGNRLQMAGAFMIDSCFRGGRIWELVTFQFLHAHPGHVLFNCVGLWVFGPLMERWWGSGRFLAFHLLCGVAGSLFFSALVLLGILPDTGMQTPLIGASAGIYGMLVGVARLMPHQGVQLVFPPIYLTLRQLAIAAIGIAVIVIVGDVYLHWGIFRNSGGEAGHLGGALLGLLLVSKPGLLGRAETSGAKIIRPERFRRPPKIRPRTERHRDEPDEVDAILEKIARHGIQSLNEEERETLQRAARARKKS